jgi:hypothetical protein
VEDDEVSQEAYWTSIDWKSVGTGTSVLAALAFPFIKDLYANWRTGKVADALTGAKAAETAAERIDRLHAAEYARISTDRDYWERRAKEALSDAAANEADEENARRDGLAMEDWARWYRHAGANIGNRFMALLGLCDRFVSGDLALERFQELVKQVRADPLQHLPNVPPLARASVTPTPEA